MINRYISIVLFLCVYNICKAQSISFSRVGSVGKFPGGDYVASLATSFNNKTECVKLNTGVTLFWGLFGRDDFYSYCKNAATEIHYELKLYPNPVNSTARLVGSGLSSSVNQLKYEVLDALGRSIKRESLDAGLLRTGVNLKFDFLAVGNYFLKVFTNDFVQVIPFIKVN